MGRWFQLYAYMAATLRAAASAEIVTHGLDAVDLREIAKEATEAAEQIEAQDRRCLSRSEWSRTS